MGIREWAKRPLWINDLANPYKIHNFATKIYEVRLRLGIKKQTNLFCSALGLR